MLICGVISRQREENDRWQVTLFAVLAFGCKIVLRNKINFGIFIFALYCILYFWMLCHIKFRTWHFSKSKVALFDIYSGILEYKLKYDYWANMDLMMYHLFCEHWCDLLALFHVKFDRLFHIKQNDVWDSIFKSWRWYFEDIKWHWRVLWYLQTTTLWKQNAIPEVK